MDVQMNEEVGGWVYGWGVCPTRTNSSAPSLEVRPTARLFPSPVTSLSLGRSPFGFLTWKKDSSTTCPQALGKPQTTDSSNWHTVGAS